MCYMGFQNYRYIFFLGLSYQVSWPSFPFDFLSLALWSLLTFGENKIIHLRKQSNLEWAKVLPEGWKSPSWPIVILHHRETLIHKLTVVFHRLLVLKCITNLLNLVNSCVHLRLWWLGMTIFADFFFLKKRMHYLTHSQQGVHFQSPSQQGKLDLHWPICNFFDQGHHFPEDEKT